MKRTVVHIFLLIFIGFLAQTFADYPIVSHRYLADPGALVHDGRVYLYCSNDDQNPATADGGYQMTSIVCVSSSDLKNWTDHGIVFQVPEGAAWANLSWAPSPAERDGKFYLYFGNGANGIGVAMADTPTGPFVDPIGERLITSNTPGVLPAENMWLFDPMTFIDDDGQAYIYFGGNSEDNLRVAKLNDDMVSLDGAASSFHVPYFFEAAWMHKHNDIYYFSYSTNPSNGMRIDYMTCDNPLTGFEYGGVLSPQPPNNNNNNHQAIFKLGDEWYQAYHNRYVAQQAGIPATYRRNLCVDHFSHKEDGSIETMVNTVDGVEQVVYVNPFERNDAETMNDQNGIETEVCNKGGMNLTNLENGDWIKVRGVDFGETGAAAFTASVASDIKVGAVSGGAIEIRLDEENGPLIGTLTVPYTGGMDVWQTKTVAVEPTTGLHDVYFVFTGAKAENLFNVDHWMFTPKSETADLLAINANVSQSKIDIVSGTNLATLSVTAVYADGTSQDITAETAFSVDQDNIVSIADGVVTGLNYGEVTITATYNELSDSVKVVVKSLESELTVTRIFASEENIGLYTGSTKSVTISAEFTDGHIEDVTAKTTFDNPNPEIATIENGVITGISAGEVDLTARYKGDLGEEQSTTIHVTVSSGAAYWFEAECAEVGENWEIVKDKNASNDNYVTVQAGTESLESAPPTENLIVIPFTIDIGESYAILGRLNCPSYNDDSFWVQVDDGSFTLHNGLVTSGWDWIKFGDFDLAEGEHTLSIGYREDGARLDKICVSNYLQEIDGEGEEAENLCTPSTVENNANVPERFSLEQNYPNPFNPVTNIKYQLAQKAHVTITVFNTLGQKVETLVDQVNPAGYYTIPWNAASQPSGVYFVSMETEFDTFTQKIMLIK